MGCRKTPQQARCAWTPTRGCVSTVTELVGREEEFELLLRRWSKAKTGEG
jgi:hypothetical protein